MFVRRSFSLVSISAASILFGLVPFGRTAAQDVRHLCSEKYQAAKAAGTLNGDTWPQFYSKCTAEAKANPPAAEAAPAKAAPLDIRHICSEKYQAAKAAGTLNGEAWPQYYSRCTAETKANPPAAEAAAPPAAPPPPAAAPPPPAPVVEAPAPPPPAPAPVVEAPPPPAPVVAAPGTAVFPTAIAPAHAGEKPGKARQKTCLDQYNANKATNANGGLKWIQKGGGYYSECNKRLKG
jgi:cell division protein FtsN